eukprot:jgi/Tetstr1/431935/TSEL_021423.t1
MAGNEGAGGAGAGGWAGLPRQCVEGIVCRAGGLAAARCEAVCRTWRCYVEEPKLWKQLFELDLNGSAESKQCPWREAYRREAILAGNWARGRARLAATPSGHKGCVTSVAVGEGVVVSGSYGAPPATSTSIRIQSIPSSPTACSSPSSPRQPVWPLSGGTRRTCGAHRTVKVWDRDTGQWLHVLKGHTGAVTCVTVAKGLAVSGSRDRTVCLWDYGAEQVVEEWAVGTGQARCLAAAVAIVLREGPGEHPPAGKRAGGCAAGRRCPGQRGAGALVVASDTLGRVVAWRARGGRAGGEVLAKQVHQGAVYGLALGEGGACVSASLDRMVRVWDISREAQESACFEHEEGVLCVTMQDDLVVTGAMDGVLRLWDRRSARCAQSWKGHTDWIRGVGMHADTVVTGSKDHTVRLWDKRTSREVACLCGQPDHGSEIRAVSVDAAGIAAGFVDGQLRTWDFRAEQR